jgi:serine/threonine protein kinase
MWTIGVVLYFILTGDFPFKGGDNSALFKSIRTSEPSMGMSCSEDCKNLLKELLNKDPKMRISAVDALKHDWFKGDVDPTADLAQGGSNKGSVAGNITAASGKINHDKAVKSFTNRISYNLDLSKKIQSNIGDGEKGKKLDKGIITSLCKKMDPKVSNE